MDREAQDPFQLLEDIESELGIKTYPMNWPIGSGKEFKGVYDRKNERIIAFNGGNHGATEVEAIEGSVDDERFREILVNIGRPDAEHLNDQDVINTFVWMLSELSKKVGITQTIKDYGAKEEDFEMLADKAMEDPCKPGNPREVSKEDFINLYRQAM